MNNLSAACLEPYIGLKPFTEQEKDRFFGRDRETSILLDKIRANRLTLLLAASGVGKSSLLQAGIMPVLRADDHAELIYHNGWAAEPGAALRQSILNHYAKRPGLGSFGGNFAQLSLKDTLLACTLFGSGQQILLLDQFEEFFNYQRFQKGFKTFVEELSAAVLDRSLPACFVFSMREDFALELNAFKPFLPGVFDSYFRLEKLTRDQARLAIEQPLKQIGWSFAPKQDSKEGLLEQVLDDLAKREQERQFGVQELLALQELPLLVEPPHLQIVCQELWQHHRDEAAKQITHAAYQKAGQAEGILETYFLRKIGQFNKKEQVLASAAFDHLVGQRATKVAHPLERLAELTRADANALKLVLDKLQDCAVLRRQKRGEEFWYELYHDIFSESIDKWNREFKHRQRVKRLAVGTAAVLIAGGLIFAGNNWRANYYGRWLQSQEGVFNRIEVNRGTEHGWDVFGLRGFLYESPFLRWEMEADKRFDRSLVEDKANAQDNLVGRLPLSDRLSVYAENGLYSKIYRSKEDKEDKFVENILKTGEQELIRTLPAQLAKIRIAKIIALLLQLSEKQKNKDTNVLYSLAQLGDSSALPDLRKLLSDEDEPMRLAAAKALGKIGDTSSASELVNLLANATTYKDTRKDAASALGKLGDRSIVSGLIKLLVNSNKYIRMYGAELLGNLGDDDSSTVPALVNLLADKSENVRQVVARVLGNIGDSSAMPVLVKLLADEDAEVRRSAAYAVGMLGDSSVMPELFKLLADTDAEVQRSAAYALSNTGDNTAVPELIKCLADKNRTVLQSVIGVLGSLGDSSIVHELVKLLADTDAEVRQSAVYALSSLGDSSIVHELVKLLADTDANVRQSVAEAIGNLGDTSAVPELIKFLADEDSYVQLRAAAVLGSLGDRTATPALLKLLADRNENVRQYAAAYLGRLGDSAAVPALGRIISDTTSYMRDSAAEALSSLGDNSAVPSFMEMLKDSEVRTAAVAALGRLRTMQAAPEIIRLKLLERGNRKSQRTAAFALAQMNAFAPELQTWRQRAFNKAQEKFAAQNASQRTEAAQLLCAIATKQAAALLVQLINDPNREVAQEAIRQTGLLAELHPEWIKPEPLLALLNQPNVNLRRAAIKALGQLVSFQGEKKPTDLPDVEQKVHAVLRTLVSAEQKDFAARKAALDALGAAGRYGDELLAFLNTLEKGKDDSLRYRCLHWLGRMKYAAAKEYVENELKALEQEKAAWREERLKTEQNELKQQDKSWPNEHWEYMLGNALASIAPEKRGIALLGHPLHYVRQGAVRALAGKANADLIGKIIQAHQEFDPDDLPSPFPYTAFQAIDLALWNLEYTGKQEDVKTLQDILKKLPEKSNIPGQDGAIKERLEWTIERLNSKTAGRTTHSGT
ncbi:HEAT repeat domain-containing protein [Candidatus Electronema sp. TJ]|uniref:HEAT repeat domain-containing protein n=1 Tax=Candidatus Electronema sp. TJ TaxID=3401573 RepID=UPI003AA92F36